MAFENAGVELIEQNGARPGAPPTLLSPLASSSLTGTAVATGSTTQAATIGRRKNVFRPPNVFLWAVAVGHHRFKLAAVGGAQSDICSLVHASDSHTRVRQGIPKRIEMLDLVH